MIEKSVNLLCLLFYRPTLWLECGTGVLKISDLYLLSESQLQQSLTPFSQEDIFFKSSNSRNIDIQVVQLQVEPVVWWYSDLFCGATNQKLHLFTISKRLSWKVHKQLYPFRHFPAGLCSQCSRSVHGCHGFTHSDTVGGGMQLCYWFVITH